MKKLLTVLLLLALLLPAAALADQTVDLGFAVMHLDDSAYVQPGDEGSGVLALIIPDPSADTSFYDNINVVWTDARISDLNVSAEEFAQEVIRVAIEGMAAQGAIATNEQLLGAELDADEEMLVLYYTLDVDYTNMGIDLQTTLHFAQLAMSFEGDGMYTFTCTATSAEGVDALMNYILDAMEFAE